MNLKLFYGDTLVGDIDDAFFSDDTGYGAFRLMLSASPVTRRLRNFIMLSANWHSRLKQNSPASISQPVFYGADVTWRPLKG